jgi:hypothetical protein
MRDEVVPSIIRAAGNQAVAAYRSYFEAASRSRNTRRLYASYARRFFEWAERRGLTPEMIDASALAVCRAELAAATSSQTASVYLAPVRGVFRALAEAGVLAGNPCSSMSPISWPASPAADGPAPPMPQTPEEWQAAADAAEMALALDGLMQYGLIEIEGPGLSVNADR